MEVTNPLTGCLMKRRIKRAQYCLTQDVSQDMINWFISENGCTPEQFLAQPEHKKLRYKNMKTRLDAFSTRYAKDIPQMLKYLRQLHKRSEKASN